MFDGMGHGVSAGAAQGEVKHYDLICGDESCDAHNKDQVPEEDVREDLCWTRGSNKRQKKPAEVSRRHKLTYLPMRGTERDVSGIF